MRSLLERERERTQLEREVENTGREREREHSSMGLTWHCSEVEVFPYDLLKLAVHGSWSKTLTQIQPEVLTQYRA